MENEILQQILNEIRELKAAQQEARNIVIRMENEHGQQMQEIKNILTRMENEHGQQLTALFDGYSSMYDISKEIRQDVVALKSDQEKHELHIKRFNSQKKA